MAPIFRHATTTFGFLKKKTEKGALLVGVAVPDVHDPAEVRGVEGHGGHWRENHLK